MPRLTIIGYGNPLRGDDGVGWFVANRLIDRQAITMHDKPGSLNINQPSAGSVSMSQPKAGNQSINYFKTDNLIVEVLALHQLTPELAEDIGVSKSVIFIDACCDLPPGHVSCRSLISHEDNSVKHRQLILYENGQDKHLQVTSNADGSVKQQQLTLCENNRDKHRRMASHEDSPAKHLQRKSVAGSVTHHLDPYGLLAFAYAIYGVLPETALLVTVGGKSFGYEEGLSEIVTAAVPIIEQILESHVANHTASNFP
jgi:Ni,Fe-hydrogenase maturation factor